MEPQTSENTAPALPPGTTIFGELPDDLGELDLTFGDIEITRPCSTEIDPATGERFEAGRLDPEEMAKLESMIGQARVYGEQHADEFGTVGLLTDSSGERTVYATFTTDLDLHHAAIAEIVAFPDLVLVCQTTMNAATYLAVEATLLSELNGRFLSIGRSRQGIAVGLPPGAEATADDLVERYGPAIELRVGDSTYPVDAAEPSDCRDIPAPVSVPDLDISVVPTAALTPDEFGTIHTVATLTNTGSEPLGFSGGNVSALLLDPAGRVVSNDPPVLLTMQDIPVDIEPGASVELPLFAGVAACDPSLGSELPPGDYLLVAEVTYIVDTPDGVEILDLVSEPQPVTIAD